MVTTVWPEGTGRRGLNEALAAGQAGGTLVITKLDRFARPLPDAREHRRGHKKGFPGTPAAPPETYRIRPELTPVRPDPKPEARKLYTHPFCHTPSNSKHTCRARQQGRGQAPFLTARLPLWLSGQRVLAPQRKFPATGIIFGQCMVRPELVGVATASMSSVSEER
jgi:hypothetical protein